DLSAAEASARDARAQLVSIQKELTHQQLSLNRWLGLGWDRDIKLRIQDGLPSNLSAPLIEDLLLGLEDRRLDLLALRRGYESQDHKLRAAILAQFPKISIGFNAKRDTSNVETLGCGVEIDLPLFSHNQTVIAEETVTRQKLFDEYV